jgi:excisionase family DNA binding protein
MAQSDLRQTEYDIDETARLLRRHPRTVHRYIEQGMLHPTKVGRKFMFPASEVRELAKLPPEVTLPSPDEYAEQVTQAVSLRLSDLFGDVDALLKGITKRQQLDRGSLQRS